MARRVPDIAVSGTSPRHVDCHHQRWRLIQRGTAMTRPLQIIFRNMAVTLSLSLEREVHTRAAWLETFYDAMWDAEC
jgi:hypothetical protein